MKLKHAMVRCCALLFALAALAAAGCDPVWWVRRDAHPTSRLTAGCIRSALARAGAARISTHRLSSDPTWRRFWCRVDGIDVAVTYHSGAASTLRASIGTRGLGTAVAPERIARIRRAQRVVLEQLRRSCGPIAEGAERCSRAECPR